MIPQVVQDFLRESLTRLRTQSPKFFVILQAIFASLALVGFLPTILHDYFNIEMSHNLVKLCKDVGLLFTGGIGGTMFTASVQPQAITESGSVVVTNVEEHKYPYTAGVIQRQVDKNTIPVVEDPKVK